MLWEPICILIFVVLLTNTYKDMKTLMTRIGKDLETLRKELLTHEAEFCTKAEYVNNDDCIYEIPRILVYEKYDSYIEYAVLRIENGIAYCGGISEGESGNLQEFNIGDLSYNELVSIGEELI